MFIVKLISIFLFSSEVFASFFIEPYLGLQLSLSSNVKSSSGVIRSYNQNAFHYGSRLGMVGEGVAFGFDFSQASYKTNESISTSSTQTDFDTIQSQFGIFIGYQVSHRLNFLISFYPGPYQIWKKKNVTYDIIGGGYCFILEYLIVSNLYLNMEYRSYSYSRIESSTNTSIQRNGLIANSFSPVHLLFNLSYYFVLDNGKNTK